MKYCSVIHWASPESPQIIGTKTNDVLMIGFS